MSTINATVRKASPITVTVNRTGATGQGVPAGGLTNQVLAKVSDADNDTLWRYETILSVNGKTGVVVLTNSDVGAAPTVHTHTASQITDFDTEVSNNTDVAANTAARHTHANKALLDTYSQTEANLADAVAKKHSHANLIVLDNTTASFTTAQETKLAGIAAGAEVNVNADWNASSGDAQILNKPFIPTGLDDLSDVQFSGPPAEGDILVFRGDTMLWENGKVNYDNLDNLPTLYTSSDFATDFAARTTDDLTEGGNKYFTDQRAIDAIEAEPTLDLSGAITASNLSGTNTGDQTSIVGITGSIAQFNSALTGADFATLAGSEVLTNKTISGSSNTLSNIGNSSLTNSSITIGSTSISLGGTATTVAGLTLTTPTIASFTNATHNHTNAAGGGQLTVVALSDITASATELNFTDGVTSAIQDQIDGKIGQSLNAVGEVSLNAGGTGYTAGDVLTISGGTTSATVLVTSIGATPFPVTGIRLLAIGAGYSTGTGVATTGGTGTGATVDILSRSKTAWYGGSATTDGLLIDSNTQAWGFTNNRGKIVIRDSAVKFSGQTALVAGEIATLVEFSDTVTAPANDIWGLSGFFFNGVFEYGTSQNLVTAPAFRANPIYRVTANAVADGQISLMCGFYSSPAHQVKHNGSSSSSIMLNYVAQLNLIRSTVGGTWTGTHTITDYADYVGGLLLVGGFGGANITDGYTVTNLRTFWSRSYSKSGTGTVTNAIALEVEAMTLGTNNYIFLAYNTTDKTNYERFETAWASNVLTVGTAVGGSGVSRRLALRSAGTSSARELRVHATSDTTAQFDFITTAAVSTASGIFAAFRQNTTASSGTSNGLLVAPTINQTSTAGYIGLLINATETATGSGTKRLIDAQVGSTSRFFISNTGMLSVTQTTLASEVHRIETVATNDDPSERVFQNRVATTDATVTTLATVTIPSSTTVLFEAIVVARRTGGSAGTAEDGASYQILGTFKNVSGTATQIGATTVVHSNESQAGFDCVFDVTGATARVRITGATNNNITWHVTYRTWQVGT